MSEEARDLLIAAVVFALAYFAWRRSVANLDDVKERIADYAS